MRLLLLTPCILLLGCADDLPGPRWFGEHVEVASTTDDNLCAGTIEHYDSFVVSTAQMLELELPDRPIPVYHFGSTSELRAKTNCPSTSTACYLIDENAVYTSSWDSVEHELVHAIVMPEIGIGDRLFSEGVAEAFGRSRTHGITDNNDDPLKYIGLPIEDIPYDTAARFVEYIGSAHGMTKVRDIIAASEDENRERTLAAIEEVLDDPPSSVESAFLNQPHECTLQVPECTINPLPWVGEHWRFAGATACGTPGAIGQNGSGYQIVSVDIDKSGTHLVDSNSAGTTLTRCGPCGDRSSVTIQSGETELELQTGRYFFEISTDSNFVEIELSSTAS